MEIRKCSGILLIALSTLVMSASCKDGGIFSRKSTVHGQVTEIGGFGQDSIAVLFSAVKLASGKQLLVVYTDADGNYSGTVDVPKGYGSLDVLIPGNGNPKFTDVYRDFDIYINGNKTKNCCPAEIGGKTQIDFRLFK